MYSTINVEACLRQKPSYVVSISHILVYFHQYIIWKGFWVYVLFFNLMTKPLE
jgi:hypothetical protein